MRAALTLRGDDTSFLVGYDHNRRPQKREMTCQGKSEKIARGTPAFL